MTDSSEIGRFGTLRLLKRHEPDTTVAFFPIDDEEVTFGRSKRCSVRLYYDCVSELHCTLHFSEERKAFLLVQGTNGLLVDGCQVNPSPSGSGPTTVPLTNGSEIEIYKKRFKFEYPPKEIRAALLATPRHGESRRFLRMSMITSAQVLTPRPNSNNISRTSRRGSIKDYIEWEALRSPVTVPGQNTQELMLLEGKGDDAIVVEEEKDLIILEPVESQGNESVITSGSIDKTFTSGLAKSMPISHSVQHLSPTQPMVRRRSAQSLHRAVVLRSAQRAQLERERYEDQQEEDEVEASVSPERDLGPLEFDNNEGEHEDEDEDEGHDLPDVSSNIVSHEGKLSVFRASLDAVKKAMPLSLSWKAPEVSVPSQEDEEESDEESDKQCEDDEDPHEIMAQTQTPIRRNFGPFMTPQVMVNRRAQRVPIVMKGRASIGGEGSSRMLFGGAQRVRTIAPWKIQDIVLPEPEKLHIKGRQETRDRITEVERQAIVARRKSALQMPTPLPIPGPRNSGFPPPRRSDVYTPGENKDEDTETMLENMMQKMAHVRRQSEARKKRSSIASPQKMQDYSLHAAGTGRANQATPIAGVVEGTLSQMNYAEVDDDEVAASSSQGTLGTPHKHQGDINTISSNHKEHAKPPYRADSKPVTNLTPRLDGVRGMFRQTHSQPKTPAFAGIKMFQDRPVIPYETPSFRGVKEMFRRPDPITALATPQLNLGDVFNANDDRPDNFGTCFEDEQGNLTSEGSSDDSIMLHDSRSSDTASPEKAEGDQVVAPDPLPQRSRQSRKATTTKNRVAVDQDLRAMDESPAVGEGSEDENAGQDLKARPIAATRATKRHTNSKFDPVTDEVIENGSRPRRKRANTPEKGGSGGPAARKARRAKRDKPKESDEEPANPGLRVSGRAKRVTRQQQASEDASEADEEANEVTSQKPREVRDSDTERVTAPKVRRGRAAKVPQVTPGEVLPATDTKVARRIKAEDSLDNTALPPAGKPKPKRGPKAKATEETDGEADLVEAANLSKPDIALAPRKGRGMKGDKTPASQDGLSDDKEKGDQLGKLKGKKPTTRGRKAPVTTAVEALDAPAKRTRSRKRRES